MSDRPDSAPQAAGPARELTGRIGKFEIVRLLGKGAMGQVYLAHDTILEREIALKVMVSQIADDPDLKTRFEREAKTVARMTHPNIVTVFDFGYHTDGSPYIAMELLRGQDLQKAVRSGTPLGLDQKVAIVLQVLSGLAHAHQAGIVHRDIKPANIFLNSDGSAKLMDFGVARLTTASMTGTGNIVGTADYMSPEQVRGAKVDGRSDLFSVGCVLFELLAGRRPFHSDNLMAIFYKITHEEPAWDLLPEDEAHSSLLPILQRALSKDLDARYANASEFAGEIREWSRATGGGAAVRSALESLVDDATPTVPPASDDATVVTGPSLAGTAPSRSAPRTATGSRSSAGPTARAAVDPTALVSGARRTPAPRARADAANAKSRLGPALVIALALAAVVVVGGLAWIGVALKPWGEEPTPAASVATVPPTALPVPTPTAEATPVPQSTIAAPATTAPPPAVHDGTGREASGIRSARTAFSANDYDTALSLAQKALSADPSSAAARQIVENARAGQKAMGLLQAGERALGSGDLAQAQNQGEAAQGAAPWDPRVTSFLNRVRDAQVAARAQHDRQAREAQAQELNALLQRADTALAQRQYDQAVSLYDEALRLDPANARAGLGRTGALASRATAQAAGGVGQARPAGGRTFSPGRTQAQSVETRASAVPEGFEETPGVKVQRASVAGDLPGKILFAITPEQVSPSDRFTLSVQLLNEGAAPIEVKDLVVTTTVNGRRSASPMPSLVREVAPRQKADLMKTSGTWKEDTTSWSMEVLVRTGRGETYKNALTWK